RRFWGLFFTNYARAADPGNSMEQNMQPRPIRDAADYGKQYRESVEDNAAFWAKVVQRIDWMRPFTEVKDVSWNADDLHIKWFHDGTLNACANCVDRHLPERKDDIAIIWEGDDPGEDARITYGELYERVCRFANVLKKLG